MQEPPSAVKYVWKDTFSLFVPQGWAVGELEDGLSFHDPETGIGALNLAVAPRDQSGSPTTEEVLAIARSYAQTHGLPAQIIRTGFLAGYPLAELSHIANDPEPTFWHLWIAASVGHLAFITYNCIDPPDTEEHDLVQSIISKFAWI